MPVVLLILFGCGQLGLLGNVYIAQADGGSLLIADYGPWEQVFVRSIRPEIVAEILRDRASSTENFKDVGDPELFGGTFWDTPTPASTANVPTPTLPITTNEPTTSPIGPTSTPNAGGTGTAAPSGTSTPNPLPTQTPAPSNTADPAHTHVPSNTPSPSNTPTEPSVPTPTYTPASTNTSTPDSPSLPEPWCGRKYIDEEGKYVRSFWINGGWVSGSLNHQINAYFENNTPHVVKIVGAKITWTKLENQTDSTARWMYWKHAGQVNPSANWEPFWDGHDHSSPTTINDTQAEWLSSANVSVPANTFWPEIEPDLYRDALRVSFSNVPSPSGVKNYEFTFEITFRYLNGLECTVSAIVD